MVSIKCKLLMCNGLKRLNSIPILGCCLKERSEFFLNKISSKEKLHFIKVLNFLLKYLNLDQESNRKRGRREHRNNNRYNSNLINDLSRRGDISVIHGDCDGKLRIFTFNLPAFEPFLP